jgi:hypothetical protein
VKERFLQYTDPKIPFHRLVDAVGRSMCKSMILRAIRPIQRHVSSVPPRIDSPYVLQVATDTLRENDKIYQDPECERWRWLIWVQWHALAVTLAGLCSIRETPLANSAWEIVEKQYNRYEKYVADTKNGMLWRPIEKLHRKAQAFRDEGRRRSMNTPPSRTRRQDSQAGQNDSITQSSLTLSPLTNANIDTWPTLLETPQQAQPQLNHHNMPMGSMPTDPTFSNLSMDLNYPGPTTTSAADLHGLSNAMAASFPATAANGSFNQSSPPAGDMSWMDWERIMDDFTGFPIEGGFGYPIGDFRTPALADLQAPPLPSLGQQQQAVEFNMGDMKPSAHVQEGREWPCNLHQDLM